MRDESPDNEALRRDAGLAPEEPLPPDHRAGYVAVVGKPNVGKSTLMNAFVGEKVAIVSPKPQTTRTTQLGILTRPDAQIVFVDTPGIHLARSKLGEYMVTVAKGSMPDADVILFLVDLTDMPDQADELIAREVRKLKGPRIILGMNKADRIKPAKALPHQAAYHALVPEALPVTFSALTGGGRDQLLEAIIAALPEGPRYFPPDQITETQLRDNVAEVIREKVLLLLEQEVPHSVAVQVDEFKERSDRLTYIAATIYVERDSQKAIVIGQRGRMLKQIGEIARPEIEETIGTQVYLELWVKVLRNWRTDEKALRRLGYRRERS
jgi:GTP-binding protein Era